VVATKQSNEVYYNYEGGITSFNYFTFMII
jgi:hypothetical protein